MPQQADDFSIAASDGDRPAPSGVAVWRCWTVSRLLSEERTEDRSERLRPLNAMQYNLQVYLC